MVKALEQLRLERRTRNGPYGNRLLVITNQPWYCSSKHYFRSR